MPLILTRSNDEAIFIGDDIKISVMNFYRTRSPRTGLYKSHVRLAITAPENISVHRDELYYQIHPDKAPKYDEEEYEESKGNKW